MPQSSAPLLRPVLGLALTAFVVGFVAYLLAAGTIARHQATTGVELAAAMDAVAGPARLDS